MSMRIESAKNLYHATYQKGILELSKVNGEEVDLYDFVKKITKHQITETLILMSASLSIPDGAYDLGEIWEYEAEGSSMETICVCTVYQRLLEDFEVHLSRN